MYHRDEMTSSSAFEFAAISKLQWYNFIGDTVQGSSFLTLLNSWTDRYRRYGKSIRVQTFSLRGHRNVIGSTNSRERWTQPTDTLTGWVNMVLTLNPLREPNWKRELDPLKFVELLYYNLPNNSASTIYIVFFLTFHFDFYIIARDR